ncbi:hypothetical protein MSG28_013673 [Choristoneura fumiferana]|uniref:Uncharacterized protein n=1 Tax=Choristoneura fumiferana TaxID=7141 RepID=A0ACC0K993_CHOFU|nr:hypothetical protein MSG28_013673 [Choristoneura fumiferana]
MTELDKFKRRTIRSVARLLRQKKPPDELWGEMKKETGTDCRVLWERMRALCIKKLNRMLAVDDRSDSLPSIARLSLTDWLLVDLVLVHEMIDVIAMDKVDNKAEQKPLVQLFNLVQRFDVEGRSGEALAEAWAAATVYYNRQGRQCSPMLLQRRWYQLKKLTRCRFYKFWQTYRGNTRLLAEARETMPTRLQMAVAKRYPTVITGAFPEWEELIEQKLIIMPEEFESKMRIPHLPKPCSSSDPDLVVVEPVIETIELAEDSDTEECKGDQIEDTADPESSNDVPAETDPPLQHETTQSNNIVHFKSEPIEEDGLSNVQVIAATHVTELEIPDESPEHDSEVSCQTAEKKTEDNLDNDDDVDDVMCTDILQLDNESPNKPKSSEGNVEIVSSNSRGSEDDVIEIPSVVTAINFDLGSPKEAPTDEIMPVISSVSSTVKTQEIIDGLVDDIIKLKADEYCRNDTKEVSDESNANTVDDLIKDKVETFLKTPKDTIKFEEKKPDVSAINLNSETLDLTAIDLMADLNFNDDGLEFIDDGVEFVEEMIEPKIEPVSKASPDHGSTKESEDINKFDLKLLMDPVVYTTKLDHMSIFTNNFFLSVNNKEDIDKIIAESRPISKKSFDINIKEEDTASQIDNTNTNDDSGVNDDLFTNQESDDENMEDVTISLNSYMLKKPRTRTYNPIQLCKNPDFNTKLRRLAIGFFSSPRNRQLLNACIPMTIDVTKAFESKLVNGTLYLKSTGRNSNIVKEAVIDNQSSTSVAPSALPVQSLLDNSKTNIVNLIPTPTIDLTPTPQSDSILIPPIDSISSPNILVNPNPALTTNVNNPIGTERKKIINLPDIDKVRRINQQLLTAQVPPIRVYAGDSYQPPMQPITADSNQIEQINPPKVPQAVRAETVSAPPTPSPQASCMPTVVKVKSEAANDDKGLVTAPEIIPPEPLPPAKQKLLKIINQAKLTTQEALTKLDGGCKTGPSDGLKQLNLVRNVKPKPNGNTFKRYSMYSRVSVPWKPRYAPRPESIDDFLITDDTLNKMLHLMSGKEGEKNCACCSVKQKKADWKKANRAKKKKELQLEKDSAKKTQEKSTENQGAEELVIDGKDGNDAPKNAGEKPTTVLAKGRVVKYCCWARQKIWNRKRITKHTCQPDECVCCCRDALAKYLELKKIVPIEVSDDEDKSLKMACESIENVVQQSRESTDNITPQDQATSKPKLVIMRTISTSTETDNLNKVPTDNIVDFRQGVVDETEPPKVPPPVITKIIPKSQLPTLFSKKISSPKPQTPLYVPSHKEPLCVPCPCQKPTDTPAPQLSIVIDASRNVVVDATTKCNNHAPPLTPIAPKEKEKENKILYLHSKSISKSPTESPIFLGKNKILLTTVKFPRKNDPPLLRECEVFQAPKIIPTLPLPNGVQLVLLPSGSVTYTLDQGVELTEEQLASLPTIIAAVKEQLESSTVPSFVPASNPIVTNDGQSLLNAPHPQLIANTQATDLTAAINSEAREVFEDKLTAQKNIRHEEVDKIANISVNIPAAPVNTEILDTELNLNETANNVIADSESKKISSLSSNATLAIHTEPQSIAESESPPEIESVAKSGLTETQSSTESVPQTDVQNPVTETAAKITDGVGESNDKDGASNRKTLLSDLMEMSGISAEDATAAEPPTAEQAVQEQVPVFISPEQERSLPELTPVTSFAELKYACENDGKFFKLDFETGVIVPINVCIKKNSKPKGPARVKAVIDLTDDVEDSDDITSTQEPELQSEVDTFAKTFQRYVYKGKTVTVPNTSVKPVKLFKAVRPPLLKRQVKLDPKLDSLPPAPKKPHSQKRKQIFSKVDTVLDLVDSDAPMEEEYLMESSDSESSRTETGSMTVEALEELDYSSDDEPLAKKSKRMKEANEETDKIIETIPDAVNVAVSVNPDPVNPSEGGRDVAKDMDVPTKNADTPRDENKEETNRNDTQPATKPAEAEVQPEPDPEMDTELDPELDPDIDPELDSDADPELRFMSGPSDNEGGEEDCILGV